ncbi:MAG: glycosyltransferase [Candidatus Sumerlaeia bacterium]|nr:glycosyltransferase [Candidatus Sumerlaeia bacterium]
MNQRRPSDIPTVSVIIPTLDEERNIRGAIRNAMRSGAHEVIVVDGMSRDRTVPLARRAGARIVTVPRGVGRASQMNAGAEVATGDVLLFLHADTRLKRNALRSMQRSVANDTGLIGGGFHRKFRSPSKFLAFTSEFGNYRAAHLGWFLGDQAIFVQRESFHRIGGYTTTAQFDDLEFSSRLRKAGGTTLIRPGVLTSARRFQMGKASVAMRDAASITMYISREWRRRP